MNAPARFESLLWLASPMVAWAQANGEAIPAKIEPSKTVAQTLPAARTRRKRRKSVA